MNISIKDTSLNRDQLSAHSKAQKPDGLFSRKQNSSGGKQPTLLSNKPKKKFPIKAILLTILLGLIGFGGYKGFEFYKSVQEAAGNAGVNVNIGDVVNAVVDDETPELKTDSSGKLTNILVVGIDTRTTQGGLKNTDTIIVASYNHEYNRITMFSIPRDMYVNVPVDSSYYNRINAVYGDAEAREEGTGMDALKTTVEKFTGLEIQYYGMINYEAFLEIVDTLGGITIDVENTFTDYRYPSNIEPLYETVHFDEGIQEMDGETALKYARSRKSLDNGEGSDYARARRQQKVIEAIKEKLLSTETLLNPDTVFGIMESLGSNIKLYNVDFSDVEASLYIAEKLMDAPMYSFVFDPAVGNSQVIRTDPNSYAIYPVAGVGVYTDTVAFTELANQDPELYESDPLIYSYDTGLGYYAAAEVISELQTEYPYLTIVYGGTLYYDQEGIYVFDANDEEDYSGTVDFLSTIYGLPKKYQTAPDYLTINLTGVDAVILVGGEVTEPETVKVVDPETGMIEYIEAE